MAPPSDAMLRVRGLRVRYAGATRDAVAGVDLEVAPGEAVGVLGESGSGKTSLALATAGLLAPGARSAGTIELDGRRVDGLDERAWSKLRGDTVGIVFQQPIRALSPYRRVGRQIADVIRAHRRWPRRAVRERVAALLAEVGLDAAVGRSHPHRLSGGQRQRVVLCQALACEPALLLADEPTASLDAQSETRILDLVRRLRAERELALLWISHDPDVLARLVDRVVVLYGGRLVEDGPVGEVLERPSHPYTRALLACRPPQRSAPGPPTERRLPTVPEGEIASEGCPFAPRCPYRIDDCKEEQVLREVAEGETHRVACVRTGDLDESSRKAVGVEDD